MDASQCSTHASPVSVTNSRRTVLMTSAIVSAPYHASQYTSTYLPFTSQRQRLVYRGDASARRAGHCAPHGAIVVRQPRDGVRDFCNKINLRRNYVIIAANANPGHASCTVPARPLRAAHARSLASLGDDLHTTAAVQSQLSTTATVGIGGTMTPAHTCCIMDIAHDT